jgi:Rrf2 family iron-sulfur cluster assembly transcriptional regulator
MAMVDLALHGAEKPVALAEIAERQEIPLAYLEQIFGRLKKQGLVNSVRGPGGGYILSRSKEETWVSDIMLAVDEPIKMTRCDHASASGCHSDKTRCLTHDLWEGLGNRIYSYLRSISLQDVCNRHYCKTVPNFLQSDPWQAEMNQG